MVDKQTQKDAFAKRATIARKNAGMTNDSIAEHFGVSSTAVGKWFNKGIISKDRIADLADILSVDFLWLATGKGNMTTDAVREDAHTYSSNVHALHSEDITPGDLVEIKNYKIEYSMGAGSIVETTILEEDDPAFYKLSFFEKKNTSPKHCKRFTATGDSMTPTIYDNDSVLVDMSQTDIINGKVYALRYGEELKIKRIYKKLSGGIVLQSDNPSIPDETINKEDCCQLIEIHGRVIDRSGDGGL